MDIPKTPEIQALIARHKQASSEKEKAHIENDIWLTGTTPEDRSQYQRRSWVAKALGTHPSAIQRRVALLMAEPEADLLWERVENEKMPVSTAGSQLVNARKLQQALPGLSLRDALLRQLKEYDSWPSQRNRAGQVYRKRPPSRLTTQHTNATRTSVAWNQTNEKGFWAELRKHLATFMQGRFEGADPLVADKLFRDFERDLKVLFDEYQSKLYRQRTQEHRAKRDIALIGFSNIQQACLTLGMEPPKRGEPVDLALARQKKKKLARVYHPDSNGGGNEGTNAKYEEALSAFSVLEDYNAQLGSSTFPPATPVPPSTPKSTSTSNTHP